MVTRKIVTLIRPIHEKTLPIVNKKWYFFLQIRPTRLSKRNRIDDFFQNPISRVEVIRRWNKFQNKQFHLITQFEGLVSIDVILCDVRI